MDLGAPRLGSRPREEGPPSGQVRSPSWFPQGSGSAVSQVSGTAARHARVSERGVQRGLEPFGCR